MDSAYSEILRKIQQEKKSGFLHLIEGAEILDNPACLTTDLIHPSDEGFYTMAVNLAAKIKKVIGWLLYRSVL